MLRDKLAQRGKSRTILVVLLICTLGGNMLFTNVAALLPPYAEEFHPRFNSFQIGILFASYQVALIFVAPFIGSNLHKYGRKRALSLAIWLLSGATFVFGAAGYIENDYGWYGVSLAARITQGLGDAVLLITVPSIISLEYTAKQEVYLGYASMFLGLSYTIGPALAGLIYLVLDYAGTLFVFAGIILAIGVPSICLMPDRVNNYEVLDESGEATGGEIIDIPYSTLFKNRRSLMGIGAKFMGAFCLNFYDPILSLYLDQGLGLAGSKAFLGFSLISLTYAIGSIIYGKLSEDRSKRCLIFISFLFMSLSIYVSGGLEWLVGSGTPVLLLTMIGLGGVGFFQAGTLVPVIPEVMEAVQDELNDAGPRVSVVPKTEDLPPELRRMQTVDQLLAERLAASPRAPS